MSRTERVEAKDSELITFAYLDQFRNLIDRLGVEIANSVGWNSQIVPIYRITQIMKEKARFLADLKCNKQ